jgi:hypothetical protein
MKLRASSAQHPRGAILNFHAKSGVPCRGAHAVGNILKIRLRIAQQRQDPRPQADGATGSDGATLADAEGIDRFGGLAIGAQNKDRKRKPPSAKLSSAQQAARSTVPR